MTDPHGNRDFLYSLGRFIEAHLASHGRRRGRGSPFYAFCIVCTNVPGIPDHYGHSAWRSKVSRKPTEEEARVERTYRRALSFREYKGELPSRDLKSTNATRHKWDQCAEYISLPYVLKFARDYLGNGEQKKKIVVYCLTKEADTDSEIQFCSNCRLYVSKIVDELTGLRIVDIALTTLVGEDSATYQSNTTVSLNVIYSFMVNIRVLI